MVPWPCSLNFWPSKTRGDRCGEIGLRRGDRLGLVLPEFFLVTEGTEGDDGDIDVATLKRALDDVPVALEVSRVKVQDLDVAAAGLDGGAGLRDARGVGAGSQGDLGRAALEEFLDDAEADLGGAAEKEDVLCLAYCIQHEVVPF